MTVLKRSFQTLILVSLLIVMLGCVKEVNKIENKIYSKATFAGGCFWCMEADFEKLAGVVEVISGYSGGNVVDPSYEQVSSGGTGHLESAQVIYDPSIITYSRLLEHFWKNIDPLDDSGQFCDKGYQYTTAIFYHDEEQKDLAEASMKKAEEVLGKRVLTPIFKFEKFYNAEEYHQDYYKKKPIRYNTYRKLCGRDQRLRDLWKGKELQINTIGYTKPTDKELKEKLTTLQYQVTQQDATEKPFDNEYWNNTEEGIYVDVVSGEALFSSKDKYKSGTGWPSFTKPLEPGNIVEKEDRILFIKRTELRSKQADSHLGHLFTDGPSSSEHPTGTGLRYCINSAALRFIPKEDLEKEGYGKYKKMFSYVAIPPV